MQRLVTLFAAGLALAPLLAAAPILQDLDAHQIDQLARGEQVVALQDLDGKPWPKVRVYQKVAASPEEVAAVFFDYKNAKFYVPKILKSDISREITPCTLEVDYGVDIPVLPDEYYTARNTLSSPEEGAYQVSWVLVKALQTKASEGNLRIERWKDGSVIRYTNLVTPGSAMAGLLKSQAIDQMRSTVRAIVSRVESQKNQHPESLGQEILQLQEALKKEAGH